MASRHYKTTQLNGEILLRQPIPFDMAYDSGHNRTQIINLYILEGYLFQERIPVKSRDGKNIRIVKFPLKKKLLSKLGILMNVKLFPSDEDNNSFYFNSNENNITSLEL